MTVPLNASGLGLTDRRTTLAVVVHRDDGDGRFDPATDRPVRVAGQPVASRYAPVEGGEDDDGIGITTPTGGEPVDPNSGASPPATATGDGRGVGVAVAALTVGLTALTAALCARRSADGGE